MTISAAQLFDALGQLGDLTDILGGLHSAGITAHEPVSVSPLPPDRSQITTITWSALLLQDLNQQLAAQGRQPVPITVNNVLNVANWIAAESTPSSWLHYNDPLNAMNLSAGGKFWFPDVNSGLEGTASVLAQQNMSPIVAALQQQKPWAGFAAALKSSPWDANHYKGSNIVNSSSLSSDTFPWLTWATGTGGNPTGLFGQAVLGEGQTPGQSTGIGGVWDELAHLLGDLTSVQWWKRVGLGVLGVGIFGVGLVIFLSETKAGKQLRSEAEGAAPLVAMAAA